MNNKKRYFFYFLILLVVFCTGCNNVSRNDGVISVEYFYYPSCENCKDGEAFATDFEYLVSDILYPDDYEIKLKNITVKEYLDEYEKIVDELKTDTFFPNPPFLIVDGVMLIGQEEIDNHLRDAILEAIDLNTSEKELREKIQKQSNEDSYFIYFYSKDCSSCVETDSYISKLDKVQYVADGNSSQLRFQYINSKNPDNLRLMTEIYDAYNVLDEHRKVPIIFWKDGYLYGKDAIKENLINIIRSGEAQNWNGLN